MKSIALPSAGTAPSATTTIEKLACARWRCRRNRTTLSMSNGRSGARTTSAPPAMPAFTAIQPACRPMTSTTMTRLCDSAVVWSRSIASVAMLTAVWNPMDRSVPSTSLSMVFGMAIIATPASATLLAACTVPSPPMQTSASIRSASRVARTASIPPSSECGWNRAVPSRVPPTGSTFRMSDRPSGWTSPCATPFQPLRKPMTECPYSPSACFTTPRIAALRPGQSPPPVRSPMRMPAPVVRLLRPCPGQPSGRPSARPRRHREP